MEKRERSLLKYIYVTYLDNMSVKLYEWDKRHELILSSFIDKLNIAGFRFFILRNYEGLPENNVSKDVDIIIDPKYYSKSKQILLQVFKEQGLSHCFQAVYEKAHCFYAMKVENNFAIHIDLISGFSNKGFEILTFDYLYSNTIRYKNFLVLNDELNAVMLILYKVIGSKQLKERYRKEIGDAFRENPLKIREILLEVLGQKIGNLIIFALQNDDFDNIVKNAKVISSSAKQKVMLKHPVKTIFGIIKFLFEKIVRMIICPNRFQNVIAVEAPDGTGKSTFIDALIYQVAHSYVCDKERCDVYHFRPCILPNLGAVGEKVGVMKQDKNFTVPHRAKPVGKLSSFIRMTYYWLDYVIGMPIIMRKSAQFDHITIFDRYIYDFLVDPRRARINLPYWVRKMFAKMVKQPKIVFVLETDAETILNRKQELTKDEIERQLSEFRKLENLGINVHYLDASKKPDEMAMDAIKIVLDTFANKL